MMDTPRPTAGTAPGLTTLVVALLAWTGAAWAQNLDPADIQACSEIETASLRLDCYDRIAGRETAPVEEPQSAAPPKDARGKLASIFIADAHHSDADAPEAQYHSLLDSRWELDPSRKLGTLNLRGYQPVFLEPVFLASHANQTPTSPNPDNTVHEPQGLNRAEAKFQISFKTKLAQGLFNGHGDLWAGYTQSSRWQVYNSRLSRPFRETDYEPEAMLLFDTNIPVMGWRLRMLGAGFNHQSNGRAEPLSRSWNRIMGYVGLERPDWTIMWRPWLRVPERRSDDDNPDITHYLGRGDLQIIHESGGQEFMLNLRHSFSHDRGAARFTWSFPVSRGVRGYMEVFNGYGESLIDYNHHATHFGLGVTLLDWY